MCLSPFFIYGNQAIAKEANVIELLITVLCLLATLILGFLVGRHFSTPTPTPTETAAVEAASEEVASTEVDKLREIADLRLKYESTTAALMLAMNEIRDLEDNPKVVEKVHTETRWRRGVAGKTIVEPINITKTIVNEVFVPMEPGLKRFYMNNANRELVRAFQLMLEEHKEFEALKARVVELEGRDEEFALREEALVRALANAHEAVVKANNRVSAPNQELIKEINRVKKEKLNATRAVKKWKERAKELETLTNIGGEKGDRKLQLVLSED